MLLPLKTAILANFPELTNASFRLLTTGWDSMAVDVDDQLIFKFPRDEDSLETLRREVTMLEAIQPHLTLSVPRLVLCETPRLFSRHVKLQGDPLTTSQYNRLSVHARQQLAETIARFYAELHALSSSVLQTAGALPIDDWPEPAEILTNSQTHLPVALAHKAERLLTQWTDLPTDPYGLVYGFFDGHGSNMAFDHDRQVLNGIFDFGDAGFGDLHQEFIYTNFISTELTSGVIDYYEQFTGRVIDRQRVELAMGLLVLTELAELNDHAEHGATALQQAVQWLSTR